MAKEPTGPVHPKPPPRVAKKAPPPQKKDIAVPPKEAPTGAVPNAPPSLAGLPFVPVAQMPVTEDAVINNLMAKELMHPSGPPIKPDDSLVLLTSVISGIKEGSVKDFRKELERESANQVEKAELITSVLNGLNFKRLLRWLLIQDMTEQVIERAAVKGELTSGDAIVLWGKSQPVIKECRSQMEKTKPIDSPTVINKIDIHTQAQESASSEVWAGTTPQGREIIRKKLQGLHKRIAEVEEKPLVPPKPATRK